MGTIGPTAPGRKILSAGSSRRIVGNEQYDLPVRDGPLQGFQPLTLMLSGEVPHCGDMPALRITLPHLSSSDRIHARNSSGVLARTSIPCVLKRSAVALVIRSGTSALFSFATMPFGVPDLANSPCQPTASYPGNISATVGTLGRSALRASVVTARSFSLLFGDQRHGRTEIGEHHRRVPLAHLLGPSTLDEVENSSSLAPYHRVSSDGYHFREIKLQQLDAAALRRLAGETDQITWLLKIDQMSESLEATLLKLRESLLGWYEHLNGFGDPDAKDNLVDQISSIKTSADIDKSVEQLAAQNLKIYGGTYVHWNKEQARHPIEDYPLPILRYTSQTKAVLSIAPEDKNNSTSPRCYRVRAPAKIYRERTCWYRLC